MEKKDGDEVDKMRPEIKLLFFGTFFHENTELTADLIQLKETTQITEVRVIPLGATVDLSTGSFQLGATNPSEFELEFYYNDLQVPAKSTFELLKKFKFNDKSRIQLICEGNDLIITDGLLVRGVYSTITLAVYGFTVDKVPIKELPVEIKEDASVQPLKIPVSSGVDEIIPPIDSPEKIVLEPDAVLVLQGNEREAEAEVKPVVSTEIKSHPPAQAISTITTRVNYDAVPEYCDEPYMEECVDELDEKPVSRQELDSSLEEDLQNETTKNPLPPSKVLPEVMDTEEISDGEVFPSDDEEMAEEPDVRSDVPSPRRLSVEQSSLANQSEPITADDGTTVAVNKIDPLVEEVEPIISPPQDQLSDEEDLVDEFQEPGFEEILSDDEIPDFPDYDYGEWEENWAHKFTRTFNPFSDTFQVSSLKNFSLDHSHYYLRNEQRPPPSSCWQNLMNKVEIYSSVRLCQSNLESWVEDMELLLTFLPHMLWQIDSKAETDQLSLRAAISVWADVGTNLEFAKEQSSLPFKTRHIKVGLKLIQTIANWQGSFSEHIINLQFPVQESDSRYSETTSESLSLQERLVKLLMEPYMNSTAKLLILRTLDATVSTKTGLKMFTAPKTDVTESASNRSAYQQLLMYTLDSGFSVRLSFSFKSLQRKIKLMLELTKLEDLVKHQTIKSYENNDSYSQELIETEETILNNLREAAVSVDQCIAYPLRLLPSHGLIELPTMSSSGHDSKVSYLQMLKELNFIQVAAVLVNTNRNRGRFVAQICGILAVLLKWEAGLIYLASESDSTTILLRSLLQLEDDISSFALLFAHCMEIMKCIDIMSSDSKETLQESRDDDIKSLQVIASFLTTVVGREALVATLSQGNFIIPLLKSVQYSEADYRFGSLYRLEKCARKGYAVEILDYVIRNTESTSFLQLHGPSIYNIIQSLSDRNEGCEKLIDAQAFLKPTINPILFTLEGIEQVSESIKAKIVDMFRVPKNVENNWGIPADLITYLRILSQLVIPPEENTSPKDHTPNPDEMIVRQLKFDLALVKMHSQDMTPTLLAMLNKIIEEFQQPATHSYILVSRCGDAVANVLSPVIKLLKRMISQVIQTRKGEFRDVVVIPHLVKLYSLIEYFPAASLSYGKIQEVGQNIVNTLLCYTIPAIKQGAETEEELNKSTWTAVVSEIIKFTLDEPANFQPGLALLSELLPLPLPVPCKSNMNEEACMESIKVRRLWSAYLHGLTFQLQEMTGILSSSSNPRVVNLLKRVCIQLADLSSSSCLVICRGLLDSILQSMEVESDVNAESQGSNALVSSSIKLWVDSAKSPGECQCSSFTARLLGFLASLVSNYAPIKCGVMQVMKGGSKIDDKYADVLMYLCSVLTSPSSALTPSHIQGQDQVITIFQSFCDVEINMLVPIFGKTEQTYESDFLLCNSLPPKEQLSIICSTILIYLSSTNGKSMKISPVVDGILRTLEIVAETDYGFFHLRKSLEKNPKSLYAVLESIMTWEIDTVENFETNLPCIMSYIDLMKSIITPRPQQMGAFPPRLSALSTKDLFKYLCFEESTEVLDPDISSTVEESSEDVKCIDASKEQISEDPIPSSEEASKKRLEDLSSFKTHPLIKLTHHFLKYIDNMKQANLSFNTIEVSDLETGLESLEKLITLSTLKATSDDVKSDPCVEQILPLPETLQDVYQLRPVFVIVNRFGNDNLPIFWLTSIPPAFEIDAENNESELISMDFEELSRNCLNNYDVINEIENLTKTSDTQSPNGKEKLIGSSSNLKPVDLGYHQGEIRFGNSSSRRPPFSNNMRGGQNRGMFSRGMLSGPGRMGPHHYDPFRSRPPNTSRPPSLHVDDFVAMESSGQSSGPPMARQGMSDGFSRGRGNSRGSSMLSRPFSHDRGRMTNRSNQGQSNFFQSQRQERATIRGVRGGRVFVTPNSERWTADSRNPSVFDRNANGRSSHYDDKYRSGGSGSVGPSRNVVPSPRTNLQPYPQRPAYRDNRPGVGNNNNNQNPRWRDRQQRQFNR